jgi:lipopolysaccharide biosynthesis glycosyltransferase
MDKNPVRIVLAADDNYARPLAVTVRSVVENLAEGRSLEVFVLPDNISAENRRLLEQSLGQFNSTLHWVDGLAAKVADLPTHDRFPRAAFGRLLIPELLPSSIDRVLYLDCDLVVRHSIHTLYDSPLDGHAAMAVPDMGAPFVSCPHGLPLWYERRRQPHDFNFNAGVMLMDLDQWRSEGCGADAIAYLASDEFQRVMADQEALNAVLGTKIGVVDPHWNQQGEIYSRIPALALPYDRNLVKDVQDDPWIIHYSTGNKPWARGGCGHPWVDEWFRYLDNTAYAGWRPRKLPWPVRLAINAKHTAGRRLRQFGWI